MESYKERHVTWLENFYDLVVAIIVFQLSRDLDQDVSVYGFLSFVSLFIPVMWSWIGVTFYSTRFETDDLAHRLPMLLQIAAAAFMAVSVPDGLGKNSIWFALSYAVIRTILVIEYLLYEKTCSRGTSAYYKIFHRIFNWSRNMACICICTFTN